MPVTPITEIWLRSEWLAATQETWGRAMDTATEQWRGILLMMAAINQPDDAWKNAHLLTLFDNGNSLTNVLYWIATRPAPSAALRDDKPAAIAEPPSPPLLQNGAAKSSGHEKGTEETSSLAEASGLGWPWPLWIVLLASTVCIYSKCVARARLAAPTQPIDVVQDLDADYQLIGR